MKRFLIALLVGCFAFSLVACGSAREDEKNNNEEIQQESQQNVEEITVELAGKLQVQAAWQAVVAHGKTQYDAFEVRYMPGQPVDEIAEDADTWLLRAECFVNSETKKCEAKVTGTTENPEVISFKVY